MSVALSVIAVSKAFTRRGLPRLSTSPLGWSTRVIAIGLLRNPPEAIVA